MYPIGSSTATTSPIRLTYYPVPENTVVAKVLNEHQSFNSNESFKYKIKILDPSKLTKENVGQVTVIATKAGTSTSITRSND
jgi:hypothetical protein